MTFLVMQAEEFCPRLGPDLERRRIGGPVFFISLPGPFVGPFLWNRPREGRCRPCRVMSASGLLAYAPEQAGVLGTGTGQVGGSLPGPFLMRSPVCVRGDNGLLWRNEPASREVPQQDSSLPVEEAEEEAHRSAS